MTREGASHETKSLRLLANQDPSRLMGLLRLRPLMRRRFSSNGDRKFPFEIPKLEKDTPKTLDQTEIEPADKWEVASRVRIFHPDWSRIPMKEDDVRMIGDYPDYGSQSYQERDPHVKYFDQQGRRHFGEGVPEDFEVLSVWAPDISTRYGWAWMLGGPAVLFGGSLLIYMLVKDIPSHVPPLVSPISCIIFV